MIQRIKLAFSAAALGALLFACLPPRQQGPLPKLSSTPVAVTPTPEPTASSAGTYNALFYAVHPNGDAHKIIEFLAGHPDRKITFLFPPRYFEAPGNKEMLSKFRVLQSTGQIEIALTLENEPNLALLSDLNCAFPSRNQNWGFNFSWPDDTAGQIARASGAYQKRWSRLPGGLIPPYLALNDAAIKSMARFRLSWTVSHPQFKAQAYYVGATAVLLPPALPTISAPEGSPEWARNLSTWTVSQPFAFVNGSGWTDPASEMLFLQSWDRASRSNSSEFRRFRGEELLLVLDNSIRISSPEKISLQKNELADWVQSSLQRSAWAALAEARKALESYKNSGRAVITRLDAATEEMMNAESGPFLLGLGRTVTPEPSTTHLFVATLANVYRLTGTPIPSDLNRLFTQKKWSATPATQAGSLKPFFETQEKMMAWNDPAADDFGDGAFRYPLGVPTNGAFDLTRFSVSWTDDDVIFSFTTAGPIPNPQIQPLLPLVDLYIDINRLTSAGSLDPLPQRGGESLDRDAAWEYALSLSPLSASLYQPLPGREPRFVQSLAVTMNSVSRFLSVRIPRDIVRGDPSDWRYTVTLGGYEQSTTPSTFLKPLPITVNPSNHSFGGGLNGRNAPRIIDLLAPTADDQKNTMQPYTQSLKVILPYVEAP